MKAHKVISGMPDLLHYSQKQEEFIAQLTIKHAPASLVSFEAPDIEGWENVELGQISVALSEWIPRFQQRALALYHNALCLLAEQQKLDPPPKLTQTTTVEDLNACYDNYANFFPATTEVEKLKKQHFLEIPLDCRRRVESAFQRADQIHQELNIFLSNPGNFPVFQMACVVFGKLSHEKQGDFLCDFFDGRTLATTSETSGFQCGAELGPTAFTTMRNLIRESRSGASRSGAPLTIKDELQRQIHLARIQLIQRILRNVVEALGTSDERREIGTSERRLTQSLLTYPEIKSMLGLTEEPIQGYQWVPVTWVERVENIFLEEFPHVIQQCAHRFLERCITEAYLPSDHPERVMPLHDCRQLCLELSSQHSAEVDEEDFRPVLTRLVVRNYLQKAGLVACPPRNGKSISEIIASGAIPLHIITNNFVKMLEVFPELKTPENRELLVNVCFDRRGKLKPEFAPHALMIANSVLFEEDKLVSIDHFRINREELWMHELISTATPERLNNILIFCFAEVGEDQTPVVNHLRTCIDRLPDSELKNLLMIMFFTFSSEREPVACFPKINAESTQNGIELLLASTQVVCTSRLFEKVCQCSNNSSEFMVAMLKAVEHYIEDVVSKGDKNHAIRIIKRFIPNGRVAMASKIREMSFGIVAKLAHLVEFSEIFASVDSAWLVEYFQYAKQSNTVASAIKLLNYLEVVVTRFTPEDREVIVNGLMESEEAMSVSPELLWNLIGSIQKVMSCEDSQDMLPRCIQRLHEAMKLQDEQPPSKEVARQQVATQQVARQQKIMHYFFEVFHAFLTPQLLDQIIEISQKLDMKLHNFLSEIVHYPEKISPKTCLHMAIYHNAGLPFSIVEECFMRAEVLPEETLDPFVQSVRSWLELGLKENSAKDSTLKGFFESKLINSLNADQLKALMHAIAPLGLIDDPNANSNERKVLIRNILIHCFTRIRRCVDEEYNAFVSVLSPNILPDLNTWLNTWPELKIEFLEAATSLVLHPIKTRPIDATEYFKRLLNALSTEVCTEIMTCILSREDVPDKIIEVYLNCLKERRVSLLSTRFLDLLEARLGGSGHSLSPDVLCVLPYFENPGVGTHDLTTASRLEMFLRFLNLFILDERPLDPSQYEALLNTFIKMLPMHTASIPGAVVPAQQIFCFLNNEVAPEGTTTWRSKLKVLQADHKRLFGEYKIKEAKGTKQSK